MTDNYKKLSANKLAEYIDARPQRRATIVRQQKCGTAHPTKYYALAQSAMSKVMAASDRNLIFDLEKTRISTHPGWGNNPEDLISNNFKALQRLMECAERQGLFELAADFRKPAHPLNPLRYGDVQLSNRFDSEIVTSGRRQKYGGVKYYINKNHPLSDFSGAVLAALLQDAMIELVDKKSVSAENVIILDAFQGKVFRASSNYKNYIREAEAAMREFSMHWDTIEII
ncbi:MAG: hypothetical protein JWM59_543 [Verrucomicrobiales bacterium]|nr:hypothetical protein [Verrucomicrobiales bacterium]